MTLLSIFLISFLLFCSFTNSKTTPKPKAFIFPINKDNITNQYYTNIQIGANSTTFSAVIDLGGKFLWFYSEEYVSAASSFRPILCGTQQCRNAAGFGCTFCFLRPPQPGCTNNTCTDESLNPFTGTEFYGGLGLDVLHVHSTRGDIYNLNSFAFQYGHDALLLGLASQTIGLVGLGRTKISLPAQLATTFKIREKFTLCVPSSGHSGNLIIGQVAYNNPFQGISKSLITTPLIRNPVGSSGNNINGNFTVEYFIDVKSIRVDNKALIFNNTLLSIDKRTGDGGTSLRTVRAYTNLHRSIYTSLVNEFVKAALSKNITRVASVAPFGACFDAKSIVSVNTGPQVPVIDFVMKNKSAYWRFYGSNSMIRVSSDVMCLAFVERTPNIGGPSTSIVLGGYQMENYLLEFDVTSSKLGFSPSLLLSGTSCSEFKPL